MRLHSIPEPKLRNLQAVPDNVICIDRDSLLGLILERRGSVLRRVLLDADLTRLVSDLLSSPRGHSENQTNEGSGSLSAQDRRVLFQGAIIFISKVKPFLHFFWSPILLNSSEIISGLI